MAGLRSVIARGLVAASLALAAWTILLGVGFYP
jgi:hypothetical protein